MPEDDKIIDEVRREIKGFGDNIRGLQNSMKTDLEAVRKIAEDAKKSVENPEVKSQLEALKTSVLEKHDAIDQKVKELIETSQKASTDRLDDLERKFNKNQLHGGGGQNDQDLKFNIDFMRTALSVKGQLKVNTALTVPQEDLTAYKGMFPLYMRKGEQHQDVDLKAMQVGSDPDGGFLVTPRIGALITGVYFDTSPMRQIASVETISTDSIEYPRDDDQAAGGWVGEIESRTETNTPTVGVQRIPVHELYAMPKASQKLLEDAAVDVEGWLARKVADIFARTEATAFCSGDGVKKPRGFLTYATGTYSAGTVGLIEQVNSGNATDFTFDSLINLMSALKEPYAPGAVWLMRRATTGLLMLKKDGNGQYLWQPNVQAGKPSVVLGHSVYQAADMPAVGAGNLAIAFGNFGLGYRIVDRLGISVLRDPYTAKPFVLFYTRKRVGGDVVNFEAIKLMKIST